MRIADCRMQIESPRHTGAVAVILHSAIYIQQFR
jgi:hypothetical protein